MATGTTRDIIACIESLGFTVMNWKPGNTRIYKVLGENGTEASGGMFAGELRAWFRGYLQGLKGLGTQQQTETQ